MFDKFLIQMDFSRVRYSFNINGHETFRTRFGGFLYLFFVVILVTFGLSYTLEFITRNNFNLILHSKVLPIPPVLNFTEKNMDLAYSLSFEKNYSILTENDIDLLFIEKIYLTKFVNTTDKIKTPLSLEQCGKNHFKNKYIKEDTTKNFENFRCFKKTNLTLIGKYSDEIYQYIEIGISLNLTTFKNMNSDFKRNFLTQKSAIKISIQFMESTVDIDNKSDPISTYIKSIYDYINISKIKKVDLFFMDYLFEDKQSMVFDRATFANFIQFEKKEEYIYDNFERLDPDNDSLLFKYYLRSSQSTIKLSRLYQKISFLMAEIGGVVSNILILIVFFNTIYNTFKSKEKLANSLLNFKENFFHLGAEKFMNLEKLRYDYEKKFKKNYIMNDNNNNDEFIENESIIGKKNLINKKARRGSEIEAFNQIERLGKLSTFANKNNNNNNNNKNKRNSLQIENIKKLDIVQEELMSEENNEIEMENLSKNLNLLKSNTMNPFSSKKNFFPVQSQDPVPLDSAYPPEDKNQSFFNREEISEIKNPLKDISNESLYELNYQKSSDRNLEINSSIIKEKNNNNNNNINKNNEEEELNNKNKNIPLKKEDSFKLQQELEDKNNSSELLNLNKSDSEEYKTRENNILKLIEKNKKLEQINLNSSVCEILCRFFKIAKFGKNKDLIDISLRKIDNHLNIFIYFKLIQEIEIIKRLLFNNHQLDFINFIARPTVNKEKKTDSELIKIQQNYLNIQSHEEKMENVTKSFGAIINNNNLNPIDHSLIEFFNQEFENILEI